MLLSAAFSELLVEVVKAMAKVDWGAVWTKISQISITLAIFALVTVVIAVYFLAASGVILYLAVDGSEVPAALGSSFAGCIGYLLGIVASMTPAQRHAA